MSRRRGPKLHDCGEHGQLSARRIAELAGITEASVYARLGRGVRGEALLQGAVHVGNPGGGSFKDNMHVACAALNTVAAFTLARDFAGRSPSVEQIKSRFGCSRATAYRYRAAWREVFGEPKPLFVSQPPGMEIAA